jgi:hypothetical protein
MDLGKPAIRETANATGKGRPVAFGVYRESICGYGCVRRRLKKAFVQHGYPRCRTRDPLRR